MGKSRDFHLGDILSITTGRLVSPRHVGGVYDILNFLTGDNLFTHQLPRAERECKPYVLKQHPCLKEIDASPVTPDNWRAWLDRQIETFGETLPIEPIAAATKPDGSPVHEHRNPITELCEKVGPEKVVVVVAQEEPK